MVYVDFDWLDDIELIGELSYESLRGSDNYGFKFDNNLAKKYRNLFLSSDLNNYPGQQYTQPGSVVLFLTTLYYHHIDKITKNMYLYP